MSAATDSWEARPGRDRGVETFLGSETSETRTLSAGRLYKLVGYSRVVDEISSKPALPVNRQMQTRTYRVAFNTNPLVSIPEPIVSVRRFGHERSRADREGRDLDHSLASVDREASGADRETRRANRQARGVNA